LLCRGEPLLCVGGALDNVPGNLGQVAEDLIGVASNVAELAHNAGDGVDGDLLQLVVAFRRHRLAAHLRQTERERDREMEEMVESDGCVHVFV
jgi:hypothetical protein